MSLYDKITKNYNYKEMKNYNIFKPLAIWANVNSELEQLGAILCTELFKNKENKIFNKVLR